jgi:hypothetical protein
VFIAAITATFQEARLHINKAEETSNLDSDNENEGGRRRRKTKHISDYDDDTDDSPPQKPARKQKPSEVPAIRSSVSVPPKLQQKALRTTSNISGK